MQKTLAWLGIIAVVCAGGFLLWRQQATRLQLHQRVIELRIQSDELARLRQENRRLAAEQPAAAELNRLRADHAAIPRLRAEIDGLQARIRTAAEESTANASGRFAAGNKLPASDWKKAGTSTAQSGLETILWAAAGGDIDTFAQCLLLPEGRGRQQAVALLESLPATLREQYGTPERLVAFLAIKDVPLGTAQVVAWDERQTASSPVEAQVQLSSPDGQTRDLILQFSNPGGGWKLVVPDAAIARYASVLKGAPTAKPKADRRVPKESPVTR